MPFPDPERRANFLERLERAGLLPDREEALAETIREQRWILPMGNSAETARFELIDGNGRVARSTAVHLTRFTLSRSGQAVQLDLEGNLSPGMRVVNELGEWRLEIGGATVLGVVQRVDRMADGQVRVCFSIWATGTHEERTHEGFIDQPFWSGRLTAIVPIFQGSVSQGHRNPEQYYMGLDFARDTPRNRHIAALAQGGRIYPGTTQPISPIPQICRDCQFLCGERHDGNLLVCAVHPSGNGEDCKDFKPR
ncbi:hypothetical protein H6F43_03135 [Leptolyngbya sp. FACHB-36]|uniref:hypothetical protein n=1 Tax=Leptolyngbya sp. FACHB-36 TaxID=2692808 RepID=UPI0016819617|nr:hypothetical protein [Leptolyngbya sp. FACHB-36]MBD2019178.1 hypothetical protein [Leptolyngbya sp. FACHB-36]